MPRKKQTRHAKMSESKSRKSSSKSKTLASRKVAKATREMKAGTLRSGNSGKKVTNRKQAIAIGLSEARRQGARVPQRTQGRNRGNRRTRNT